MRVEEGIVSLNGEVSTIEGEVSTINGKVSTIKEGMFTKQDLKNLGDEIARQNPCLKNAKSIFPRYPK